jgi:DNA ligase-1
VNACFDAVAATSGAGSIRARVEALAALLARATAGERELLGGLLMGELRQGALRALVIEAIAVARRVDAGELRRAVMNAGSLGAVVAALAEGGEAVLARFTLTPLIPVEPMLAATAGELEAALVDLGGEAAAEHKLDGVRIQLHRLGDEVRVFTRSLRDVTAGSPELVALARSFPAERFILDGELVWLDDAGAPAAFQDLMSRFQTEEAESGMRPFFFDALHLGEPLVERPDRERRAALEGLVGAGRCVPRRIVTSAAEAQAALEEALDAGHEGLVLKALDAPYQAGRRGGLWRKVKTAHTLDLVILAAEWGHGRRRGWLSNLHLGARDAADPERFWMLGKTFKGLTDAMLRELTAELHTIAVESNDFLVRVRPERVVEIAFDDVQRSTRYDSGFALRFARVKRFRPDKTAAEATTLDEIRQVAGTRKR